MFTGRLPGCNRRPLDSWKREHQEPSMQQLAAAPDHGAAIATRSRLGRLGAWAADHSRAIAVAWCGLILVLGGLAPFADRALSGAGWEASGSQSVAARHALEADFPGRGSYALTVVMAGQDDGAVRSRLGRVEAVLRGDPAVSGVRREPPGGHTGAVVTGLAGGTPEEMVQAAGRLKGRLARLSSPGLGVRLTGPAAMWSDFNADNKAAMLKSEMLSWPLTLALLLLAFGTLIAAGLPLLLTMAGLAGAGGLLFVAGQLTEVSIWAMNFAMMFAIALGIDYALFIVVRFRSALAEGLAPREATAVTMATAGKAVLVSGLTVIAALLALMLVPVPAFRSVPVGIALAVLMVLAATLTLLPAVLSRLGHRINGGRVRMRGAIDHRSERFAAWGRRLWARPLPYGVAAVAILLALAAPVIGLRTGMPTAGGATGPLQILVPDRDAAAARSVLARDRAIVAVAPAERSRGHVLLTATPAGDAPVNATIDRIRAELPAGALLGGPAAEMRDVQHALVSRLPIVVGVALGLGFMLLLALLRAPLAAAAGVAMSLLATAGAFGVARLVFQDGALDGLLGWHAQGFIDAWAPIFFFALIFALAMDYTVFLLASVKAVHERSGDVQHALVEGLAGTGRVINAAAGVMVVVYLTFALSGPIAPREMGVILAVAVLLDAALIRLLLQPVVLRLLGARAWWMPAWLDRLVPAIAGSVARRHGVPPARADGSA
jgi:putative drug exporter of the RND superfamily